MENHSKNLQRINEMIRVPQVRVISNEGEQLGVMPTSEALNKARDLDLDLVEVAPDAKPPVCKIMNYGKFKYQQRKKGQYHIRPEGKEYRRSDSLCHRNEFHRRGI